jgi:hypothetical protein
MYRFACASHSNLLEMATPSSLELFPHFLPLLELMTSRYRGENAVPFSLKGVGIPPTVGLSVVIGMNVPLLSFPRFHGFGQTIRTSWFAIKHAS